MHKPKDYVECPAVLHEGEKKTFCWREFRHEGDHRGQRAQWNEKGERVKVTLALGIR